MKKKIVSFSLIFCMVITLIPFFGTESSAATSLQNKKIYRVSGYTSGDCVLSANVYMLRRAAIMRGYSKWSSITNKAVRAKACHGANTMRNQYVYSKAGIRFQVVSGSLPGTSAGNRKKLISLLKKHPEGVVVLGTNGWGPHGALISEYKKGVFYCADSAQNYSGKNKGITRYTATTMGSLKSCYKYWYLKKVSGRSYTVKPVSVSLSATKKTMGQGSVSSLKAVVAPSYVTSKSVKWSSSNRKVATVDSKGKITAVAKGKATITARTSNGKKRSCVVSVTAPAARQSTLKLKSYTSGPPAVMVRGSSAQIRGIATSNFRISTISITVKNSGGKTVQSGFCSCDSYSVNLYRAAYGNIRLNQLDNGNYTMTVTARDRARSKVLKRISFKVRDVAVSGYKGLPATLAKGKSVSLKGKIRSCDKIKKVNIILYRASGKQVQKGSYAPNGKTAYIQKAAKKLRIGKLAKGRYKMKITAKTEGGVYTLKTRNFTVK